MNKDRQTFQKTTHKENHLRLMVSAAVFAALAYVVFAFLSIPVPTPGGGKVSVHLGNAVCILGALILGPVYGSVGGALGLTIADLFDPVYIVEAPVTFFIKLLMGVIAGTVAHKCGKITRRSDKKGIVRWVFVASAAGLLFNIVCDPAVRYFYKILVLGKPAADVSFAINIGVTAINSAVSLAVCTVVYMLIRVSLQKAEMFFYF